MKALHPTPESLSDLYRLYLPEEAGKDGYAPEWHHTIKHAVRAEAGHRCERCKHPYRNGEHGRGEWTPCDEQCTHKGPTSEIAGTTFAHWRILTVHHLDGVKLNCRWFNLVALCQRDHLMIQGKVQLERPWPWPHSEWFRPYAAAWYALKYLDEELTREETLARLDSLLAMGIREESSWRMPL